MHGAESSPFPHLYRHSLKPPSFPQATVIPAHAGTQRKTNQAVYPPLRKAKGTRSEANAGDARGGRVETADQHAIPPKPRDFPANETTQSGRRMADEHRKSENLQELVATHSPRYTGILANRRLRMLSVKPMLEQSLTFYKPRHPQSPSFLGVPQRKHEQQRCVISRFRHVCDIHMSDFVKDFFSERHRAIHDI